MTPASNRRVPDPNIELECTPLKHRCSLGWAFWYDHGQRAIITENASTSIRFIHSNRGMESCSFVLLMIDGTKVQLAQKDGKPFPPSVYRGPQYTTTWVIGSIGVPLYYDQKTKRHWSASESGFLLSDDLLPVAADSGFASKRQQDAAMTFIVEALRQFSGEWIGACRGIQQKAEVYIRPELQAQLNNGDLIQPQTPF